jgi:hypothetical protein
MAKHSMLREKQNLFQIAQEQELALWVLRANNGPSVALWAVADGWLHSR